MRRSSIFSSEPRPPRWRVDLVLLGVVLALVGVEVAIRAVDHPRLAELRASRRDGYFPPPHRFDAELGYRYEPAHEGIFERTDFRVTLRTNRLGWRDREFDVARSPDTWRVALVGSSFLAANQVDVEEIWASRLEASIGEVHGRPVEILNFGVDGYRPWNMRQLVRHELPDYQPDLVVLWSTVGSLAMSEEVYRTVDRRGFVLEALDVRRLNQAAAERNARLMTFSEVLPDYLATTRVLNALLDKTVYSNFQFVGGQSQVRHDPVELVRGMRDDTEAAGGRFVQFTWRGPRNPRALRAFPDGLPHELLGIASYSDEGLLPAPETMRFEHDVHWTPQGHALYAERTARVWRQLLEEQLTQR